MRAMFRATSVLVLGLLAASAQAEETSLPAASPVSTPQVTLGRPVPLGVVLDRPLTGSRISDSQIRTAAYTPSAPASAVAQAPPPSAPALSLPPLSAPAIPTSPAEQYNCGVVTKSPTTDQSFWDKCTGAVTGLPGLITGRTLFQSDHTFDGFISPITNPFYFEDPRSLTELRPLFLYQATPTGNPIFRGGDIEYVGLQGRLALTDCFSLVMTKLGEVWIEPHNATPDFQDHAGFAELIIGPKYTFWRNESTGTLAAAGLNFVIPTGSAKVLQNTGTLTLEPYLSAGQRFCQTSYGTFHALGTIGYNASINNQRSDNLFTSFHLDFDYGDLHKIYPLIEFNWFYYTKNGNSQPLNFEGRDLFNFGSTSVSGHGEFTVAPGVRYKVNECFQMGFAAEFQLTNPSRSLMDYRLMVDLIFRY